MFIIILWLLLHAKRNYRKERKKEKKNIHSEREGEGERKREREKSHPCYLGWT